MAKKKTTVYILVQGGVVQAVLSTDKSIRVDVMDMDGDFSDEMGAAWTALLVKKNIHGIF
jgi:hypothetical protein